ncbi:hypothetical protein [Frondihabitans cladoniiphilus]|uniref:Uncharacterized protein n=1 Tax=Frondihabitans cladoniiphilus TaxID=715785 RepID=A0ABP8W936_9MICO
MRRILIALAIGLGLYGFVKGRRTVEIAETNVKRTRRKQKLENAARQKPGQVKAPKIPKIKRAK